MRFVINESEHQEALLIVTGKTTIGTIKGVWKDIKEPIIGEMYHVELSIDAPEEAAGPKVSGATSVYLEDEDVIFVGLCEDSDQEVYYLRFESDWLDMLDSDVISGGKKKGDYISFSADWHDIGIYPYDL